MKSLTKQMGHVYKALNILDVFGMSNFWKMEILLLHVQMELLEYGHQIEIASVIHRNLKRLRWSFLNIKRAGKLCTHCAKLARAVVGYQEKLKIILCCAE